MQNENDVIQKLNTLLLQYLSHRNIILESGNAKDYSVSSTGDHDFEEAVARVQILFNN